MSKNSLRLFKTTSLLNLIATSSFLSFPVFANDICNSDASDEIKASAGCDVAAANELPDTIINIVTAIIGVSGLVAVIFIIIGGIQYITSEGDAAKTKKAKDTILYAFIGLIICALAFVIVNWVIRSVLNQG
ncbi:hypothetical protein IKD82_02880 [Candidatus Saccharibacteria bacterium]|nr:hypothetical protein [Candidatus Saccharibacteria bacterium]